MIGGALNCMFFNAQQDQMQRARENQMWASAQYNASQDHTGNMNQALNQPRYPLAYQGVYPGQWNYPPADQPPAPRKSIIKECGYCGTRRAEYNGDTNCRNCGAP